MDRLDGQDRGPRGSREPLITVGHHLPHLTRSLLGPPSSVLLLPIHSLAASTRPLTHGDRKPSPRICSSDAFSPCFLLLSWLGLLLYSPAASPLSVSTAVVNYQPTVGLLAMAAALLFCSPTYIAKLQPPLQDGCHCRMVATVSLLRISTFTRPEQPPSPASVAVEDDLFRSSPPLAATSPRQGTSITARRAPPDVAPLPSSAESLFLSGYTARPLPHLLVVACLQVFFRSIQPMSRLRRPRVLLASVQREHAKSIAKKPVALPCFTFTADLLPSSPSCGPKHTKAFV